MDGYKHVVDVEDCPPVSSEGPYFPAEAAKAKEAAQNAPSTMNTVEYHEIVEGNNLCHLIAVRGFIHNDLVVFSWQKKTKERKEK